MARPNLHYSILAGHVRKFEADENGATAIEYAMIAAGIAGAIIATIAAVGTKVSDMYNSIGAAL